MQELEKKLDELEIGEEARRITKQEIKKLKQLGPRNQEYHVSLNYLNTIADLPWGINDVENLDPEVCREVLEKDHYGLKQVKTRII